MAVPVHAPRVNNNDDQVKLVGLEAEVGHRVAQGEVIGQVETDKAVIDIESPADGFVLGLLAEVDETVEVGSILLWLGETADEPMPEAAQPQGATTADGSVAAPTAKARLLLRQYGLSAESVPSTGPRLTAQDVERHLATLGRSGERVTGAPGITRPVPATEPMPDCPGELKALRPEERGMLHTVVWSRDHAVPGYLELEYDPQPWDAYAKAYADRHRLMLSPLFALMAWRLVELARETPILNATVIGEQRLEYSQVNLGFTVQAGQALYLTVIRDAGALDESGFVNAMGDVQRRAMAHKLNADEVQGTTISFSSMARWKVSRHVPILPPQTAIMIAHALSPDGRHVLGASYDHRVLNGFQVVSALRRLTTPAAPPGRTRPAETETTTDGGDPGVSTTAPDASKDAQ